MRFIGLDKTTLLNHSDYYEDGFYRFSLGRPVEVMTLKSDNSNKMLASVLNAEKLDDKFLLRYKPTPFVFFSEKFLRDENEKNVASIFIDSNSSCAFVGHLEEFSSTNGVLCMSSFLTANLGVDGDRRIFSGSGSGESILKRIQILSLGVRGDELLGLFYIPNTRGIYLEKSYESPYCFSLTNGREKLSESMLSYTIEDWFVGAKIKEVKES